MMIRSLKQKIKKKIGLSCCILFILFVFACGGDIENQVPSSGSGSIAFSVEWTEPSNLQNNYSSDLREKPDPLDCQAAGIVYIEAEVYEVYDEYDNYLVSGGPWICSVHSGIIYNIPSGLNRKIVILAYDSNGNIKYRGEVTGITITCGKTTDVGVIQAFFIDYSGIWYVTEQVNESLGECREDIGRQNDYSAQMELMADGNASITISSHPQRPDMSDKTFIGEFKDNHLIVYSDGMSYNCEPECSGTLCYNGQLTIDLTFSVNDNATGMMKVDSCCGDGGYTVWSINAERTPIFKLSINISDYAITQGRWDYNKTEGGSVENWSMEVIGTTTKNNKSVYIFQEYDDQGYPNDQSFYYIVESGFYNTGYINDYQTPTESESIFTPEMPELLNIFIPGQEYIFNFLNSDMGPGTWTLKIESDSITVPAGIYEDCYKSTVIMQYGDKKGIETRWYARNIGLVKRTFIRVDDPFGTNSIWELTLYESMM